MEKVLAKPITVKIPEKDLNDLVKVPINPFLELARSRKIDPDEDVQEAHACLSIMNGEESIPIARLGDFSLVIGKAKSKKTFSLVMFFASLLNNGSVYRDIVGNLPPDKRKIVFFDTEQSKYDVAKVYRRICRLIKIDRPENLEIYRLRGLSAEQVSGAIEAVLYDDDSIGFAGIDGARDLITDINNQSEAVLLSKKLMKWTEDRNIHIMTVLHQNKGDQNARGHLGTELINKAQTVLAVELDTTDKNISIIDPREMRGKSFNQLAFYINDEGLPELMEDFLTKKEKSKKPEMDDLRHKKGLIEIFSKEEKQNYKDLVNRINIELEIGDNKAKQFLTKYKDNRWVLTNGKEGTKAVYYTLGELS
jgi:hypothetical protein